MVPINIFIEIVHLSPRPHRDYWIFKPKAWIFSFFLAIGWLSNSVPLMELCALFFCLLLSFQGVQISGLGTFTFTRQQLEMGNKKFVLVQRPVFIMSEKLVQTHGLKQNKVFSPGKSFYSWDFSRNVLAYLDKWRGQNFVSTILRDLRFIVCVCVCLYFVSQDTCGRSDNNLWES